jgi:glycosyltransferase involved in cell wall biosynthesis
MASGANGKTPRVLIVGSSLAGGGAETRVRLLARHLFNGTADVAVFQADKRSEIRTGQYIHALGWSGRNSYPRMLLNLRTILVAGHYDAAIAFGLHQNALLLAAARSTRARPAVVLTETTRPDTNGRQDTDWLTYRVRRFLYQCTYPMADLVAANSIDGMSEIVANYSVPADRARRIPNIVSIADLMRLAGEPTQAVLSRTHDSEKPVFCMVTRLDPMKRVDTLLEAASLLPRSVPWNIEVIGDGPHRAKLQLLAHRMDLGGRIRFLGWLENPYPYMVRACATVLCSNYEGFSNTVLESMALGTPVVTSFCSTDACSMVARGAALGFSVGDSITLAGHLKQLLAEPGIRYGLTSSAFEYIVDHLLENAIPIYERLIVDAIAYRHQLHRVRSLPSPSGQRH